MSAGVFSGEPGECDFCGRPMFDERFFADAELPGRNGRWGILCGVCCASHGIQAGWGRAQFYERTKASQDWICVAGGAPEDLQFELPLQLTGGGVAACG